jgi:hypothetical protein
MATAGTVLAKYLKMYVGSIAITCQVDASVSLSTNMIQTTCKDSGADAAVLPGEKSWEMSVTGNLAYDATYGWNELLTAHQNQTLLVLVLQTGVTGDKKLTGSAYINSLSQTSSGNDEAVTFDAGFTGTGALVSATI